ncbi:hypothetical protein D9M71_709940 [compost metagenome]
MLVGGIGCRAKVPSIHGGLLATVVTQLGATTGGDAGVNKELVGALLALGVPQPCS